MPRALLFLFLLAAVPASAQKIYGTVFTATGDLLPFSSITIKGTSIGASANEKGKYSFTVTPGTYVVVCQHVGYKKQESKVTITKNDEEITFILARQDLDMTEVVVKKGEDPAYAIIRQAIRKRSY
ncbi:MAG TPA: carboxypeptidase-like regulatory domain-containing protein [Ferruginibacter sp.]|nr:carboxypeptidase-like regulatory domain-containing protein [Ferruginibacter sp.]